MQNYTLSNDVHMAGEEVAILAGLDRFTEDYVHGPVSVLAWAGVIPLTLAPYNAATYAAYTVVAPPPMDTIMFNADCSAFKCGNNLFFGEQVVALIEPTGSRVYVA